MVLTCKDCLFRCEEKYGLIKHCFETHSMEPTFTFICGIGGCLHTFKFGSTISSFKTHASRKHPSCREESSEANNIPPSGINVNEFEETGQEQGPSEEVSIVGAEEGGVRQPVTETAALKILS